MQRQQHEKVDEMDLIMAGTSGIRFLRLIPRNGIHSMLTDVTSEMFSQEMNQSFSFVIEFAIDKFLFIPEDLTSENKMIVFDYSEINLSAFAQPIIQSLNVGQQNDQRVLDVSLPSCFDLQSFPYIFLRCQDGLKVLNLDLNTQGEYRLFLLCYGKL